MRHRYYPHTWAVMRYVNYRFNRLEKLFMASLQDVKDSIATLGSDVAAEIKAVSDKISQLSQNGGASSADLDDLKNQIDGIAKTITDETSSLSGQ